MAFSFSSGTVAIVSVAGVDISGALESAKLDRKAKSEMHHVLGSNPVVTLVHSAEFTFTLKGLNDATVDSLFTSNLGPPAPVLEVIFQPQGADGMTRTFNAFVTDFSDDVSGDKTGMFDATMAVSGAITDS